MVLAKEIAYDSNPKLPGVQKASAAIMGIAMTQYAITAIIHGKNRTVAQDPVRRLVATTPLLLYSYWALAERGLEGRVRTHGCGGCHDDRIGLCGRSRKKDKNVQMGLFAASLVPYAFIPERSWG
jgi:hypothetical protein